MWACLSLLLALCLLPGGGAETAGGGPRCNLPPDWKASRIDSLRQKLEDQGLTNVNYMVVNQHREEAQRLHSLLAQRLSENITLYKQETHQPDIWQTLNGEKDDFIIYDRCGRLTYHISLPYSVIGHGHIESAIRYTYCKRMCGECIHESPETPQECSETVVVKPKEDGTPEEEGQSRHGHGHHHRGHHGVGHHHVHGNGQARAAPHGHRVRQEEELDLSQTDSGQQHMGQQVMNIGQMLLETQDEPVMRRP